MKYFITLKKTFELFYSTQVEAEDDKEAELEAEQYASSIPLEFDLYDSVHSIVSLKESDEVWEYEEFYVEGEEYDNEL